MSLKLWRKILYGYIQVEGIRIWMILKAVRVADITKGVSSYREE